MGQVCSKEILNREDGLAADPADPRDMRNEKQCGDEEGDEDLKPDESFGNRCSEGEGEAGHVQPASPVQEKCVFKSSQTTLLKVPM